MTNLRICILTETYYPVVGGGETQARALAQGLAASGAQVIVLTRRSHASLREQECDGATRIYRLPPVGSQHLMKWGLLLSSLPALLRLRREYDLIFVSGFRIVGFAAVIVGKLLRKPCVLKADSLGEMSGEFFVPGLARLHLRPSSLTFRLFLWLRNAILRHADRFVAISSEIAQELIANGVRVDTIENIPNGVDTDRFCPVDAERKRALRRELGIPLADVVVTYTGRLVSYKGLPLLLQVWRQIRQAHHNVRLLLVGSGGLDIHNCEAELKQYVVDHGLGDSVCFVGQVSNVHEYLQASDIFVFPTENEAFGISLIEAMACALPVVATSVGGAKDILRHRQNGLVMKVGDFQQFYESLVLLLTDHSLSTRLGQAARQTVYDTYSMKAVIQAYIRLFTHVAERYDKAPAADPAVQG